MNKKQLIDKIQSEINELKMKYEFMDDLFDKANTLGKINGLLTAMLFIYELEEH